MNYTVITGASVGLGDVFARRFAQEGRNLILVARRKDKLDQLAQELGQTCRVQVHALAMDLAKPGAGTELARRISDAGWAVQGLINNAGFGDRGAFVELPIDRQLNMIQLNVGTLVELSHSLLPSMLLQPEPFIINVASTAAFQAGPRMAVYYATKAFVLSFSEALHEELKGKVAVSALCPGPTATEFASEAHMTNTMLFKVGVMSAQHVVDIGLRKRRRAIVVAGLLNRITVFLTKLSPRSLTRKIAGLLQM
jgi:short-subunit dehydrogenase